MGAPVGKLASALLLAAWSVSARGNDVVVDDPVSPFLRSRNPDAIQFDFSASDVSTKTSQFGSDWQGDWQDWWDWNPVVDISKGLNTLCYICIAIPIGLCVICIGVGVCCFMVGNKSSSKPPPPAAGVQMQDFNQPGMQQPGMMQPGMQQPGMMYPGMQQPAMQQPGMQQPQY